MCDGTSRAKWTYIQQGTLNIPQIRHCVHNWRPHIIPVRHSTKIEEETFLLQLWSSVITSWSFCGEALPCVKHPKSAWHVVGSCCIAVFCYQRTPLFSDKIYSNVVNWSRNIPITGSKHFHLTNLHIIHRLYQSKKKNPFSGQIFLERPITLRVVAHPQKTPFSVLNLWSKETR